VMQTAINVVCLILFLITFGLTAALAYALKGTLSIIETLRKMIERD